MKKLVLLIFLVSVTLLVSGCGLFSPQEAPTPTATLFSPVETPTPTPVATDSPIPTPTSTPGTADPTPTSTSTATPTEPTPSPTATEAPSAGPIGREREGGQIDAIWNLADIRVGIHPDRIRFVVEMVECRSHVPKYHVIEVDNEQTPSPSGYDPAWGEARIDLTIIDLYAYEATDELEQLPIDLQRTCSLTQVGRYNTFDDAMLGFSIGLKRPLQYEVYELTNPVRIVIDVLTDS